MDEKTRAPLTPTKVGELYLGVHCALMVSFFL